MKGNERHSGDYETKMTEKGEAEEVIQHQEKKKNSKITERNKKGEQVSF